MMETALEKGPPGIPVGPFAFSPVDGKSKERSENPKSDSNHTQQITVRKQLNLQGMFVFIFSRTT
jgi:hypothetical protein